MNRECGLRKEEQDKSDDWRALGEKLSEVWKKLNPDIESVTVEMLNQDRDDLEKREASIDDMEVKEVLAEFGFDINGLELDKQIELSGKPEALYRLKVKNHFWDKKLPQGYGYSGGAARALLMRNLGIDPNYTPRDIDIIRLNNEEPYEGADKEITAQFMPEDSKYNHGVRDESDQTSYFNNRDLTINQVIATDDEILITRLGLLDSARHIIRLTDFEKNRFTNDIGPKMISRILRFYVEMINRYGDATIDGVEDYVFEKQFVKSFYFALQLDKAVEISYGLGQDYVDELKKRGRLPEEIESVEDAANYLLQYGFYYRYATVEQFDLEEEWAEDFERMPKRRGRGASRGNR